MKYFIDVKWEKYLATRRKEDPTFPSKEEHFKQCFNAGWKAHRLRDHWMKVNEKKRNK